MIALGLGTTTEKVSERGRKCLKRDCSILKFILESRSTLSVNKPTSVSD